MQVISRDRRRQPRTQIYRLQGLHIVEHGKSRFLPARLVDVSAGGFGLEMLVPLPAGSVVLLICGLRFEGCFMELQGRATVAHCRVRGDGLFRIGLACATLRWRSAGQRWRGPVLVSDPRRRQHESDAPRMMTRRLPPIPAPNGS